MSKFFLQDVYTLLSDTSRHSFFPLRLSKISNFDIRRNSGVTKFPASRFKLQRFGLKITYGKLLLKSAELASSHELDKYLCHEGCTVYC